MCWVDLSMEDGWSSGVGAGRDQGEFPGRKPKMTVFRDEWVWSRERAGLDHKEEYSPKTKGKIVGREGICRTGARQSTEYVSGACFAAMTKHLAKETEGRKGVFSLKV